MKLSNAKSLLQKYKVNKWKLIHKKARQLWHWNGILRIALPEQSCLCSQSASGRQMHFQPAYFPFVPQKGAFYRGQFFIWPRVLIIKRNQHSYPFTYKIPTNLFPWFLQIHKLFHFPHKLLEHLIRNGATFFGYFDVEKLGKDQRELTFWRPGNFLKQQWNDRLLQAMSQGGFPLASVWLAVFRCYATNKDLLKRWNGEKVIVLRLKIEIDQ